MRAGQVGRQYPVGGQGTERNLDSALYWFRQAAQQGKDNARNNLGTMYRDGYGVQRNLVAAYALFDLSIDAGPSANRPVDRCVEIAATMSADEIVAAHTLARSMMQPGNLLPALDAYIRSAAASGRM